jgi:hypothetical protein
MDHRKFLLLCCTVLLFACGEKDHNWGYQENEEGVLIMEGRDSVLFYQIAPRSLRGEYARNHYIHPLYSLDNTRMTEDFPEDHLHHRGIFWAWHQNYVGKHSVGDAWALEDFSWEVIRTRLEPTPGACNLYTEVHWKSPLWQSDQGAQEAFVKEQTTIRIRPAQANHRIIDFEIELEALVDSFYIGGSEDAKGYSGFSWRIPLPEAVTFEGVNGTVQPQTLAIDAGPYLDISGNLDGRPGREGIVVMDDPANPHYPNPWILRDARSMQNVAFPGREKFLITRDHPLILKYRMIVYKGTFDPALVVAGRP